MLVVKLAVFGNKTPFKYILISPPLVKRSHVTARWFQELRTETVLEQDWPLKFATMVVPDPVRIIPKPAGPEPNAPEFQNKVLLVVEVGKNQVSNERASDGSVISPRLTLSFTLSKFRADPACP